MAPFYAELGRDPAPANLMKNTAPHVFRWVERMLEPGIVDGELSTTRPRLPTTTASPTP